MALEQNIQEDIKAAMKAKDTVALAVSKSIAAKSVIILNHLFYFTSNLIPEPVRGKYFHSSTTAQDLLSEIK